MVHGTNGVVIITTKHGKSGITKIDYEGAIAFKLFAKS
jgi:hypothetical protein